MSAFEPRDGDQWDAEMGGDGGQGEVFGLSGSPQIAVVASRNTERQRDLVERMFTRKAPNRLWVIDITEHRTYEGKVYCAVVLDTFSRRVVGWSIDSSQTAALVTNALSPTGTTSTGTPPTIGRATGNRRAVHATQRSGTYRGSIGAERV